MANSSFRDLRVWQHAMDLALATYRMTSGFPKCELYGLAQQMRRAAVSVASNIAEGKGRQHDKEFRQFLFHARGSLLELETQLAIASQLEYVTAEQSSEIQQTGNTSRSQPQRFGKFSRLGSVGFADD